MPEPFKQEEHFPNLFADIKRALGDNDTAYIKVISLIEKYIVLLLKKIQVPHVANDQSEIQSDAFFDKLNSLLQNIVKDWQANNPSAPTQHLDVYIGGGVVRAILAYLYKELLAATKTNNKAKASNSTPLSFGAFYKQSAATPEYHLRRLGILRAEEQILSQFVFGVGSDLDIYINLTPKNEALERMLIQAAFEFINSAETSLGLREFESTLKSTVMPIGDVKDRQQQLSRAHAQGGSTIDWLSFAITPTKDGTDRLVSSEYTEFNILHDFIDGFYRYVASTNQVEQKQIIRGLRPLLEIPFLQIKDYEVIQGQLDALDFNGLDTAAKQQIDKLIRNSYLSGAMNRAHRESGVLSKLSSHKLIPIFLESAPITSTREISGDHAIESALVPLNEFLGTFCHKGEDNKPTLFHGTYDFTNAIYILRGGFFNSIPVIQGSANYGTGVYTTHDVKISEAYFSNKGIILALRVIDNPNIRVLRQTSLSPELKEALIAEAKDKNCYDINDLLYKHYNIDIIIASHEKEILIGNASVVEMPGPVDILSAMCRNATKEIEAATDLELIIKQSVAIIKLYTILLPGKMPEYAVFIKDFAALINQKLEENKLNFNDLLFLFDLSEMFDKKLLLDKCVKCLNEQPIFTLSQFEFGGEPTVLNRNCFMHLLSRLADLPADQFLDEKNALLNKLFALNMQYINSANKLLIIEVLIKQLKLKKNGNPLGAAIDTMIQEYEPRIPIIAITTGGHMLYHEYLNNKITLEEYKRIFFSIIRLFVNNPYMKTYDSLSSLEEYLNLNWVHFEIDDESKHEQLKSITDAGLQAKLNDLQNNPDLKVYTSDYEWEDVCKLVEINNADPVLVILYLSEMLTHSSDNSHSKDIHWITKLCNFVDKQIQKSSKEFAEDIQSQASMCIEKLILLALSRIKVSKYKDPNLSWDFQLCMLFCNKYNLNIRTLDQIESKINACKAMLTPQEFATLQDALHVSQKQYLLTQHKKPRPK